jgi:hypothetical protein
LFEDKKQPAKTLKYKRTFMCSEQYNYNLHESEMILVLHFITLSYHVKCSQHHGFLLVILKMRHEKGLLHLE